MKGLIPRFGHNTSDNLQCAVLSGHQTRSPDVPATCRYQASSVGVPPVIPTNKHPLTGPKDVWIAYYPIRNIAKPWFLGVVEYWEDGMIVITMDDHPWLTAMPCPGVAHRPGLTRRIGFFLAKTRRCLAHIPFHGQARHETWRKSAGKIMESLHFVNLCNRNASLANGLLVVVLASTCWKVWKLKATSHCRFSLEYLLCTQAQTADSSFPLLCTELLNRGVQKWGTPFMDGLRWKIPLKWLILGYPHFSKNPNGPGNAWSHPLCPSELRPTSHLVTVHGCGSDPGSLNGLAERRRRWNRSKMSSDYRWSVDDYKWL